MAGVRNVRSDFSLVGTMTVLKTDSARRRFALVALLMIGCFFGARRIGDESAVMLSGDMARYVMNGVFVHDLIADGGVTSYGALTEYAERYYAKYPALSLGHHPPVLYLSVVPFFWLVGVSILAVRLAALSWLLLAVWGMYALATRLYNWQVAAWSTALFATNLMVVRYGQYLLSEVPTMALVLWSMVGLLEFCRTHRPLHFARFIALVLVSLYAKPLAALILPVYAVVLVSQLGWRKLLTRRFVLATLALLLLIVPLGIMTVGLSPMTFGIAVNNARGLLTGAGREVQVGLGTLAGRIFWTHLSLPALVLAAAGLVLLVARRRRQAVIAAAWIVCVVGGSLVVAGGLEPVRYAFGALPAYFVLIGGLSAEARGRVARVAIAVLLLGAILWQARIARWVRPAGAGGYERAAVSVLERMQEPAMLWASTRDTGYFVFFMRKHDPQRNHVILRYDKILGSGTGNLEEDRVNYHAALQRLGVRWIVAESRTTDAPFFQMVYQEFQGPRFAERERIPVVSTRAAPGLAIILYEYLDAKPADYDAEVNISVPIGRRQFGLRLRDLVSPGTR